MYQMTDPAIPAAKTSIRAIFANLKVHLHGVVFEQLKNGTGNRIDNYLTLILYLNRIFYYEKRWMRSEPGKSSPPYKGGVARASRDGVVLSLLVRVSSSSSWFQS
jgi:hypothetical protein